MAHGVAPVLPAAASSAGTDGAQRPPVTVTLITGDKVTVAQGSDGRTPTLDVKRAPGATGSVRVVGEGGDTFVYPDEAMPYVATGRLDKQLFNVTRLVSQGYDDAHASALPLIITHPDVASARTSAATGDTLLPGAKTTLALPSVHGTAVRAQRSKAAAFWSALTGTGSGGPDENVQRSTARTGEATDDAHAPSFAAGVSTVWLDGKAEADLADSTAQVGAPAAWAAGGTGAGVRVAVLDSGVDSTHPDLAGRVVASRSFVPGDDVLDRNGHGTHTASTVAGTGAASDGKERGVAPGADLIVGKVLGDNGSGAISGIIAGMEWAARTEHAKVINMSLGTAAWHTQDDPLSQAVNQLSAETGALFVIAAGNSGNSPYSVSAPGTADAALTVGAVDSSDHLADFSSAGPRLSDDALKPDLTAPGVDVLAARSQYMNDGGEGYYRSDSGTSMAAPHVAGAAVLLAQKHPAWTGQQIKDALMGTSVLTPDYTPYQAGTGRLDVAAAYLKDQIVATGSVDAGLVPWSPGKQRKPVTRQITYTNTTDRSITLQLSTPRGASPAGVFTLAADHVTVPARGSSTVGLVADPKGLAAGQYAAQVTARSSAGAVHTAVGLSVESEKYALTVHLKDRAGKPVSGEVEITGADGKTTVLWVPDGTLTSRWAPGSYTVVSTLDVEGRHGPHSLGYAVLTVPELDLTADRTVELNASGIRQVKVATPKPTSVTTSRIDLFRSFTSSKPTPADWQALHEILIPSPAYDSLWALPTKGKVKKGSFVFTTRIRAKQTPLKITYGGRSLDDTLLVQPGSRPFKDGTAHVDAVFAGDGTAADYAGVSARGKAVVVRSSAAAAPTDQAAAARTAGAAMLLVVNDTDGRKIDWYGDPDGMTTGPLPVATLTTDEGEALIKKIRSAGKGGARLTVEAHPSPKYLYDLADYHQGGIPQDPSAATDPGSLARIENDFAPPAGKQVTESREDSPSYEYWPAAYPYAVYGSVRVPAFPREPVAAGHRTDWVSAKNGVKWQQYATTDDWSTFSDIVGYKPGSVHSERWFGPITRPRILGFEVPHRVGNGMGGTIAGFGDGGSAHSGLTSSLWSRSFALYQGDRLLAQNGPRPDLGVGDLAPESLPYRLVVDTKGNTDFTPYSSATHTEWTFLSGNAEDQAIPLAQLDYGTELDAAGRAKRTSAFSVTPTVAGSDAAKDAVSSVKVDVSYDDGKSWRSQELKESKGSWRTVLHAPARADYVSVRVTAKQRNGGGITQTVTRAFGLK
ncbi:S8 family serine peptidase [Streptomyces sp. MI02-7b]|uniref:S8 family serine peptidase n=1 Tax=Streptomyces sp. MI02-7b TaxID=462941 RepID=UPI0029B08428|nr:S8 family serine peptidase [Streptomyces sp. MI02-7b]MDX3077654.1 S8 family serine peptidase [Streptomyces sp. MI02-7b]